MKGKLGAASNLLRPVLDTYMDSAVAIVGCNSRGMGRYSCEYDVLVVGSEKGSPTSLKIGDEFVDVIFTTEKEVLRPSSPEHAISLAFAKPVRDTSLVLSTSMAASSATLSDSSAKASRIRLASALKTLGRAEVALARKATVDADLWLLASTYEFAYAWLLSKEVLPSPSHLLSQLRLASKGSPRSFEGVSMGTGLEAAGRAGCGARLEGLTVLHDLLREGSKPEAAESSWSAVRTQAVSTKANELITRIELAECYSFLGQELVDGLLGLLRMHPKRTLTTLTSGRERLLGERLVRQLGLARNEKGIQAGLDLLKDEVSLLAKS
jgi:hypothetical protein